MLFSALLRGSMSSCPQTEVHAAAQDKPLLRAAGVLLFHDEDIADLYVHASISFLPPPAYIGAGIGGIL